MKSIRKLGLIFTVLTIIMSLSLLGINIYMTNMLLRLDVSEIANDNLSKNIEEINLPIRVIKNISSQTVLDTSKEIKLKEALSNSLTSLSANSLTAKQSIQSVYKNLSGSSNILPTRIKVEYFENQLNSMTKLIEEIEVNNELIQKSSSLNNENYISNIELSYANLLTQYSSYHEYFYDYSSNVRNLLILLLNSTLMLLILLISGLIFIIYRLLNVDLKLISKAFSLLENHDYDAEKLIIKPLFTEEFAIQEIAQEYFNAQKIINDFKSLVSKNYVIDDIIDHLLSTLNELMEVERVGIAFYDEHNKTLTTEYGAATYENMYLNIGYKSNMKTSELSKIIESKKGYINNNLASSFEKNPHSKSMSLILKEGILSNMSIPLILKDNVFGIVFFSSKRTNHFSTRDYSFVSNLLYELTGALNRSYLMKIYIIRLTNTIARLVDKKDIETGDHIQRMVRYSVAIANSLKDMNLVTHPIDDKLILSIERNAAVHDIGKVGTPDYILKKPGKLTTDEFEIMKNHANVGGDIFKDLNLELGQFELGYYHTAEIIARYHHEKWDGSGYPEGLSSYAIPLESRIIAIADVFDALTSKRVYKEAFSFEKSLEIINAESGKHFDPIVVEALMRDLVSIRSIYEKYHIK